MTGVSISVAHSVEITDTVILQVANELRDCFLECIKGYAINAHMADRASIQRALFKMVAEQMFDPEKYKWDDTNN